MKITVLAGGHGGAKFLTGLRAAVGDGADLTAIVNTADDIRLHGLAISPDLDTVMYTLGGGLDDQRGWGRADEAFRANEELGAYGLPNWFGLGDRDLATHLVRTQMLDAGYRLTDVTAALCVRWDPGVTLLPMTDDRVETHVIVTEDGARRAMHFQEWWIRYHAELPASEFVQVGAEESSMTSEVGSALAEADLIVLAPSNPVVSIGAILSVPGLREFLASAPAPVVGVSPLIAGRAVRGMAEQCLAAVGVAATAADVALHYGARSTGGLLDGWLVAPDDQAAIHRLAGIDARAVPLLMSDESAAAALADATLRLGDECR
ncbi:MAG: 2-phospho-L-lactate transferase [Candidatus Nanopelagicales bacterium]